MICKSSASRSRQITTPVLLFNKEAGLILTQGTEKVTNLRKGVAGLAVKYQCKTKVGNAGGHVASQQHILTLDISVSDGRFAVDVRVQE